MKQEVLSIVVMLFLLMIFAFVQTALGYEMHGTLDDNNDGTYTVTLVSDNGDHYLGLADSQRDGTLAIDVAVQGGGSEIYLGSATPNASGNYDLHLKNNSTGEYATGTLEKSS